ncbi:MAG: hypothetical protein FWG32_09320 [Oscillospiraceae bacterium]|nr:hypothetical protein [Oscillospiraceae bacterium]
MVIKDLSRAQYNSFCRELRQKARVEPSGGASYAVDMRIDGVEYILSVQPEPRQKIAALQAVRVERGEQHVSHELVTKNCLLSALLEILLCQGIRSM